MRKIYYLLCIKLSPVLKNLAAIFLLSFSLNLYSQNLTELSTKKLFHPQTLSLDYPKYYCYAGIGFITGERIGGFVQLSQRISVEASYGFALGTILQSSKNGYVGNIGAGLYIWKELPVFISMIFTHRTKYPENLQSEINRYLSLNFGFLDFRTKGMKVMARIGFFKNFNDKPSNYTLLNVVNVDFGVGYLF